MRVKVLRITNWNALYENNKTRDRKELKWVPTPNQHHGDGYNELIEDPQDGLAMFGAWNIILQVASRCEPRGTLIRDGNRPHDAESIARQAHLKNYKTIFEKTIAICLTKIGWLEEVEIDPKDKAASTTNHKASDAELPFEDTKIPIPTDEQVEAKMLPAVLESDADPPESQVQRFLNRFQRISAVNMNGTDIADLERLLEEEGEQKIEEYFRIAIKNRIGRPVPYVRRIASNKRADEASKKIARDKEVEVARRGQNSFCEY